jgi:hypothetical protein
MALIDYPSPYDSIEQAAKFQNKEFLPKNQPEIKNKE